MTEPAFSYDMKCERMGARMMFSGCLARQKAIDRQKSRRHGPSGFSTYITTDECIGCKQGEEVKQIMENQAEFKSEKPSDMKICRRADCEQAGKYQPLDNFPKQKSCKDGREGICKKCRKRLVKSKSDLKKPLASKAAKKSIPNRYKKEPEKHGPDPQAENAVKISIFKKQLVLIKPEAFSATAILWDAYLSKLRDAAQPISEKDVAHMMGLYRIARHLTSGDDGGPDV